MEGGAWVIFGCGYTGTRLAGRLVREGARVVGTQRSEAGLADLRRSLGAGLEARIADTARPETVEGWIPKGAVVVYSAPPAEEGVAGEEAVVRAAAAAGAARLVYVGSTGVYPPAGGAWVTEDTPAGPSSAHGRRRLDAERTILGAAAALDLPAVSLRVAGIYGPGRGVHARIRAGGYRVLGAGDTFVSRIHVDDLAGAIVAAGTAEPLRGSVYNVADDEPTTSRELADAVAELLGVPSPPSRPPEEASPMARALLGADRRIDNTRLKRELGVLLAYPTWREGIRQALAEEG